MNQTTSTNNSNFFRFSVNKPRKQSLYINTINSKKFLIDTSNISNEKAFFFKSPDFLSRKGSIISNLSQHKQKKSQIDKLLSPSSNKQQSSTKISLNVTKSVSFNLNNIINVNSNNKDINETKKFIESLKEEQKKQQMFDIKKEFSVNDRRAAKKVSTMQDFFKKSINFQNFNQKFQKNEKNTKVFKKLNRRNATMVDGKNLLKSSLYIPFKDKPIDKIYPQVTNANTLKDFIIRDFKIGDKKNQKSKLKMELTEMIYNDVIKKKRNQLIELQKKFKMGDKLNQNENLNDEADENDNENIEHSFSFSLSNDSINSIEIKKNYEESTKHFNEFQNVIYVYLLFRKKLTKTPKEYQFCSKICQNRNMK